MKLGLWYTSHGFKEHTCIYTGRRLWNTNVFQILLNDNTLFTGKIIHQLQKLAFYVTASGKRSVYRTDFKLLISALKGSWLSNLSRWPTLLFQLFGLLFISWLHRSVFPPHPASHCLLLSYALSLLYILLFPQRLELLICLLLIVFSYSSPRLILILNWFLSLLGSYIRWWSLLQAAFLGSHVTCFWHFLIIWMLWCWSGLGQEKGAVRVFSLLL